jgi:hypothetical protein
MSLSEKLDLIVKSIELENQGKLEEAEQVRRQVPLQPYLAKWVKNQMEYLGKDFFTKYGWNLSEAEAAFGSDWLNNEPCQVGT